MPEQHAAVGVHVGVGVLRLAVLSQHSGHDVVDGVHDLEERVVRQVLESELALALVAGVRLAQHGVTVAGKSKQWEEEENALQQAMDRYSRL